MGLVVPLKYSRVNLKSLRKTHADWAWHGTYGDAPGLEYFGARGEDSVRIYYERPLKKTPHTRLYYYANWYVELDGWLIMPYAEWSVRVDPDHQEY